VATKHLNYIPYPTSLEMHKEHHLFLRGLCGPFGSGKSVTCIEELMFIAMRQAPADDGIRRVRFGVIRATYPNLKTTVRVDMMKWYPSECGGIKESVPMTGFYDIPLADGTRINMELLLLAAEDEADVKKLRSLNLTAIWINEATEIASEVLDAAIERVGRYPTGLDGQCSWGGIIMDYNKPPRGHWLHKMMHEGGLPDNYKLYMQPPAATKHISEDGIISYELNTRADNIKNLGDGYYQNIINVRMRKGDYDGIDQLLCLLDVDDKRGKPVWPSFSRDRHVAKSILQPIPGQELLISVDTSGIHPFAVFWQFLGRQWGIIDELFGDGTGFEDFVYGGILPLVQTRYKESLAVLAVCDPANARNSLTMTTPVMTLQEAQIPAQVAITNAPKSRIEAFSRMLNMDTGGVLISPTCEMCITACAGGYRYKKTAIAGTIDVTYSASPEKNEWSHPADAIQYGALHIMRMNDIGQSQDSVRRQMQQRLGVRKRTM
jgi:hypothetical protein